MRFIKRAGIKPILPKASRAMTASIEIQSVTAICAAQSHGERLWLLGYRHKVNMVTHQAISQNSETRLCAVGLETSQIGAAIGIREKDALLVHPALRDIVCHSNGDSARKSAHLLDMCFVGWFLSSYHSSPSPKFPRPEVPEVPRACDDEVIPLQERIEQIADKADRRRVQHGVPSAVRSLHAGAGSFTVYGRRAGIGIP
jgi:hypothetical protein